MTKVISKMLQQGGKREVYQKIVVPQANRVWYEPAKGTGSSAAVSYKKLKVEQIYTC